MLRLQRKRCADERNRGGHDAQPELLRRPERRHCAGASSRRSSRSRSRETKASRASRAATTRRPGSAVSRRRGWSGPTECTKRAACRRGLPGRRSGSGSLWPRLEDQDAADDHPGPDGARCLEIRNERAPAIRGDGPRRLVERISGGVAGRDQLAGDQFPEKAEFKSALTSRSSRARQSEVGSTSRGVGQPSSSTSGGGSPP